MCDVSNTKLYLDVMKQAGNTDIRNVVLQIDDKEVIYESGVLNGFEANQRSVQKYTIAFNVLRYAEYASLRGLELEIQYDWKDDDAIFKRKQDGIMVDYKICLRKTVSEFTQTLNHLFPPSPQQLQPHAQMLVQQCERLLRL